MKAFWKPLWWAAVFALFCALAFPAFSQQEEDPASLIGLTLNDALARFGPPRRVYAARGLEPWQDDVVFVYDERDLYVYRDRIWQVSFKAAYGIKVGDSRGKISQVFGEDLQFFEDHALVSLPSGAWPLKLHINLNSGSVSGIFLYRTDF